ncbi:MAG: prepilin-type N-terminal cleavage/methylation domain-containing protein [Candidatus Eremiobacteraeota bacterium]|nr:prepilin-type N-terminal cleavage/methylation domain-containing protein [Candidatus Eremiobacteraeota bacterium]
MQRGFTLIEMAIAVGVLAMLVLAGAAFAFGNRPMAMRQGAVEFSAQLQAARSLAAASGNGATILVKPRVAGPRPVGFQSMVFSGRPTAPNAVTSTNFAPVQSEADVAEATIGAPTFSIFISGSGHVSMAAGDWTTNALGAEPSCPAAGNYTLTFSVDNATSTIMLPCQIALGGTPAPIVTNSPTPAPSPSGF